ncbi:MAG: hypothetical protein K2M75_05475 [Clostridia bacterium]|nr:hypothetical protein [Clostridia bacterium]
MKKISIILILCLTVCMGALIFTGCNPSFGPVGTMEYKDSPVVNNGGLVVQQGGYLYYVNGMDATSNITKPDDNKFGKASVKGSIMKSKIDDNGNLTDTAVVVPKMFYTSASNGGFYIYGEWIYYLSPNTKTDNKSNVLSSQLVAFRTKIDGTKTQEIATLESNSTQYTFTDKAFIYYVDNTLKKVSYDNSKVNKKAENIAEDVTAVLFTAKSNVVFYLKATDAKKRVNNNMYAFVNNQVKKITQDTTYDKENDLSADDLTKQFTFALLAFDAKENTLFYSKVNNSGDSAKKTSTYAYKFDETYTFDTTKEVRYATTALTGSSIINLGGDKGILYTAAAQLEIYKPISETAIENNTQKGATLNSTGADIVKVDGNDMYYILSNTLYKIDYTNKDAITQELSKDSINTSWLTRSVIGNYLYYIDNTYNYMFRVDLTAFVGEPNNFVPAKGEAVSGTRKATLTKDKDGKITIKYVKDDANEEGVKYYQIPKFMTSDDAQKFAEANYEDEDKK